MGYYRGRWGSRGRSWYGWENRPKVDRSKFTKGRKDLQPVVVEGRTIAKSFWGKGWCGHFEEMADWENRLPRGRTYARNGSILDLRLTAGGIKAVVAGSDFYQVDVEVAKLPEDRWRAIVKASHGSIATMADLLRGKISDDIMRMVCHPEEGMFPTTEEISWSCSCPDSAHLCKHVAAVFYGVGHRLDLEPELIFTLRQVDARELLATSADELISDSGAEALSGDLSAIFGVEIDTWEAPKKPAPVAAKPAEAKPKGRAAAAKPDAAKPDAAKAAEAKPKVGRPKKAAAAKAAPGKPPKAPPEPAARADEQAPEAAFPAPSGAQTAPDPNPAAEAFPAAAAGSEAPPAAPGPAPAAAADSPAEGPSKLDLLVRALFQSTVGRARGGGPAQRDPAPSRRASAPAEAEAAGAAAPEASPPPAPAAPAPVVRRGPGRPGLAAIPVAPPPDGTSPAARPSALRPAATCTPFQIYSPAGKRLAPSRRRMAASDQAEAPAAAGTGDQAAEGGGPAEAAAPQSWNPDFSSLKGPDVRILRSMAGLTIDDMASVLGVTSASVRRWESIEGPLGLHYRTARCLKVFCENFMSRRQEGSEASAG